MIDWLQQRLFADGVFMTVLLSRTLTMRTQHQLVPASRALAEFVIQARRNRRLRSA